MNLEDIFKKQIELNTRINKDLYSEIKDPEIRRQRFLEFELAMRQESAEAINSLNWKWWKKDPDDYSLFIEILGETCQLHKIIVYSYCLMPNHYHLLVRTPCANISEAMRHLNSKFTQTINAKYNLDGPIFRGRFSSFLVQDNYYLLNASKYIHLNPISLIHPQPLLNYEWSSLPNFAADRKPNHLWLDRDTIRHLIFEEYGLESYAHFMELDLDPRIKSFYETCYKKPILGDDHYKKLFRTHYNTRDNDLSHRACFKIYKMHQILQSVSYEFQLDTATIISRQHDSGYSILARNISIYLIRLYCNYPNKKIYKRFGFNHYSSVSSIYSAMNRRLANDTHLLEQINRIKTFFIKR